MKSKSKMKVMWMLVTVELPIDRADAFVLAAARGDVLASVVGRR